MSWSINVIGKPADVCAEIDRHAGILSGQSRAEFDDAKEHLKGLIGQNFVKSGSNYQESHIHLEASGSGSRDINNHSDIHRTLSVSIKPMWIKIV